MVLVNIKCSVMHFAGLPHLGAVLVADAELQLYVNRQANHQDLPTQLHQTQEVTLYEVRKAAHQIH